MIIKCLSVSLSDADVRDLGVNPKLTLSYDVEIGKTYTVLGLVAYRGSTAYGNAVMVEIVDKYGRWGIAPLVLFEVINDKVSSFWKARISNGALTLWPEEFFRPFFHDDLTNGDPATVTAFRAVCTSLEVDAEAH